MSAVTHPSRRRIAAHREVLERHEANVQSPITECVWKGRDCQVRVGLLVAVHDAIDSPFSGAYQRALWALEAHHCGPMPSLELQEGAEVGAEPDGAEPLTSSEQWRPVVGWLEYEVSDHGRVRRIAPGLSTHPGKILRSPMRGGRGDYPIVGLCRLGKARTHTVHRLVAEAFLGPCPSGSQVNHKDGNRANNHVSNLEYVTQRENNAHAREMGLWVPPKRTRLP